MEEEEVPPVVNVWAAASSPPKPAKRTSPVASPSKKPRLVEPSHRWEGGQVVDFDMVQEKVLSKNQFFPTYDVLSTLTTTNLVDILRRVNNGYGVRGSKAQLIFQITSLSLQSTNQKKVPTKALEEVARQNIT